MSEPVYVPELGVGAPVATVPDGSGSAIQNVSQSTSIGVDYSVAQPSLSGLTLLSTMAPNPNRVAFFIQAQGSAPLTVALDDGEGEELTIIVLQQPGIAGGQGASIDMGNVPHNGRIRIFSTGSGVQLAAHAWPS
jgi:hypothetical protein